MFVSSENNHPETELQSKWWQGGKETDHSTDSRDTTLCLAYSLWHADRALLPLSDYRIIVYTGAWLTTTFIGVTTMTLNWRLVRQQENFAHFGFDPKQARNDLPAAPSWPCCLAGLLLPALLWLGSRSGWPDGLVEQHRALTPWPQSAQSAAASSVGNCYRQASQCLTLGHS